MGLRYRQSISGAAVHFATTTRIGHKQFPGYPTSLEIIQEIIFRTANDKSVAIMGYVIMPNHLHLIVKTKHGGNDLSRFIHSIKGRIRETLVGKGHFWQDRYDDFMIRTQEQFSIKLNYIHFNPVRAGLTAEPADWVFSSYLDWLNQSSNKGIVFDFD